MLSPIWIATALGLLAGIISSYVLGRVIIPRLIAKSGHVPILVYLAFAGTVIAVLPALVLSLVVGGAVGSAWGEHVFDQFGLRTFGAPIGLALGIALVFALVVIGGAALAVLSGKALIVYRNRQNRP